MGEFKKDTAEGVNPCAEATLEPNEPCNLQEIALPNLESEKEFIEAATLMHRYGKRVTLERYHHEEIQEVVSRNRRVGTGITGCLASSLFKADVLDRVYKAIQIENVKYSKELGIPESIRTTVIKPSGTVSKVLDMAGYEGIHAAYSQYIIQRVRFSANDPLISLLRSAGHHIEPVKRLDGTLDHGTLVVDFYMRAPEGCPVADEDWDTWKQLDVYKMAQKHWSDQSVSVSVYYKKDEIGKIKDWIRDNLKEIKSISFLCHGDHGFIQAPKEKITQEEYECLSEKIKPIDVDRIETGNEISELECEGGICPVK
jgi:ribonucleoside-triphosphate reductase